MLELLQNSMIIDSKISSKFGIDLDIFFDEFGLPNGRTLGGKFWWVLAAVFGATGGDNKGGQPT